MVTHSRHSENNWSQRKADSIIALISMAWGSSYLLMKIGLDSIEPFNMVALRFGIAFVITFFIFNKRARRVDRSTLFHASILGCILYSVFGMLMYGLRTTSASTAGFLTSTTVVFVPILQFVFFSKKTDWRVALGIIFAIVGIALLTIQDQLLFNQGALFCLCGALLYAIHILVTDRFIRQSNSLLLGIYQLGFASLFGLVSSLLIEHPTMPTTTMQWLAVLGLAIICSAFGFVVQPIAQKYTSPDHTALLFALEPVFAALFAFIFLHEVLSIRGYIGAVFVLFGVVISAYKGI
jgi:drug/metabolite transporter (DMT)-like permease